MKASEAATADYGVVGSMREGVLEQKFLLTGEDGTPNNYLLNVGRTGGGGWTTPRHRHNFDQIRYVMKGEFPYAKGKRMPEGWVGYFPEGVYYGPQDRPEGLEMMVLQFGGASGAGFVSVADREAANDALKQTGEFKEGVYTWHDADGKRHNQDGFEACFEKATGQKLKYPEPRYDDLVMMNPASFAWIPGENTGVYLKWLGTFTERNTKIGFIKIDAGASFSAGNQPSIEILFLSKGKISLGGKEYGPQSAFEFKAGEGPVPVNAMEETEFLHVILPQF